MAYDILFGASTFRSADSALRFLKSVTKINGRHLCVVVGPLIEDITLLVNNLHEVKCDTVLIHAGIDNLCLGRAWAFVWLVNHGIRAKYYCSCDDDIEFTENSHDILMRLDKADRQIGFSLMAFESSHPYKYPIFEKRIDSLKISVPWLDGNCMFSRVVDNVKFGVMDARFDEPATFYTEIEYCQRLRFLTGNPPIVDFEREFYRQHFRVDADIERIRSERYLRRDKAGRDFWLMKFGITDVSFMSEDIVPVLYKITTSLRFAEFYKRHLIFEGMWNNWDKIFKKFSSKFTVIGENCFYKMVSSESVQFSK